ncbi:hypothetical protein [Burkholderia vietnamiensis]|uniref:hypothetical protein n=1 Tax=Burkholderia vietnamiensis TaxID=60552 RepID=UPI00264F5A74|nr:hypothetical protein [Burkholderia vietnamiensis]MDN7814860.1 hypothetical protein [Burkholderia vietnamiensis]
MTTTDKSRADALTEHKIAALWETITGALFRPGSKAEEFARAIEQEVLAASPAEPPAAAPKAVGKIDTFSGKHGLTWSVDPESLPVGTVLYAGVLPAAAPIEYRYEGGTHWCDLGPAERMRPDFKGVYRLTAGTFPVWTGDPAPAPADERAAITTDGYFVYDPAGPHVEFYDTDAERDAAHRDAINEYRREAMHDQEWSTEVVGIVSGIVTHTTAELKVDEDSYDYEPGAARAGEAS